MGNNTRVVTALTVVCLACPVPAIAQHWPDRTVRIVVPFPPGGGIDIQGRVFSAVFQKSMGQNFIVDNRTGASGLIGTQHVVESAPDGYTLLFTSGILSVVVTLLARHVKFDVHNDLAPVSWVSSTPLVLSVHPSVPAMSVKELVALAKRVPKPNERGRQRSGHHLASHRRDVQPGRRDQVDRRQLPRRRPGGHRADLGGSGLPLRDGALDHAPSQDRQGAGARRDDSQARPRRCLICRR